MTNPYGEGAEKNWLKMADDLKAMADGLPVFPLVTLGGPANFSHFAAVSTNLRSAEALCRQIGVDRRVEELENALFEAEKGEDL